MSTTPSLPEPVPASEPVVSPAPAAAAGEDPWSPSPAGSSPAAEASAPPAPPPPAPGSSSPVGQAAPPQGYSQIRDLHIVRPDQGRWAAGVAAGIAQRWNIDPLLVRGGFVALTLLGGLGVLLYGVGWLLLPQTDGRIHVEEASHGRLSAGFFGAALTALAGMGSAPSWLVGWGYDTGGTPPFLAIVLVGGVIWWAVTRSKRQPAVAAPPAVPVRSDSTADEPGVRLYGTGEPLGGPMVTGAAAPPAYATGSVAVAPPPAPVVPVPTPARTPAPSRPPGFSLAFVGAALVAGTGVLAWDRWAHPITAAPTVAAAVALGVLGLGIVTAGVMGRRGGPLTFFAIVLAVVGLNNLSPSGSWTHNVPRTWTPTAAAAIGDGYGLGAGDATVDLTSPALLATATTTSPLTVPVQLGAGKLRVVVPAGVAVRVTVDLGMGHVDSRIDGRQLSGNVTETLTSGTGDPRLIVDVNVGVGDIELVSQGATS